MQILIIDSSVQVAKRLEEIISGVKHVKSIHKAENYRSGVMLFHSYKPEVVLLDSCLPLNMSIELLKAIKTITGRTFVIMLSNNPDNYSRELCTSLGADYFFDKYHDFKKLPGIVNVLAKRNKILNSIH